MQKKYIIIIAVVIALLALVSILGLGKPADVGPGVDIEDKEDVVGDTSYNFTSPAAGAEWRAGEKQEIKWTPSGTGKISLSIINTSIGSAFRYHLCAQEPPYPCELPNTGSFKFTVPMDDGHNEWAKSKDYQIAISEIAGSKILETSDKFSIIYGAEVVVPPAPGPFTADAVRNLLPKSLKVGQNTITAELRGYMFFEAEAQMKLYDGLKEVNISTRPDGLPNTVLTAQGEWMTTGYVPIKQTITIPANLKGKILVIRFIASDPSDSGKPRYWGTWVKVE